MSRHDPAALLPLKNSTYRVLLALGDDANSPRFVETVPTRGYRFVAPVESIESTETISAKGTAGAAGTAPSGPSGPSRRPENCQPSGASTARSPP